MTRYHLSPNESDPPALDRVDSEIVLDTPPGVKKTGSTVVAPLDDVEGNCRKLEPWASCLGYAFLY
ncbi:MAG: hypothetical protein GY762_03180 [Proteobacteria bacterium]|nr:hypothetical protein [Pseudomonadota bacterium]